ncbi:hypothetical protein V2J09_013039 [Rumex salicifolius]
MAVMMITSKSYPHKPPIYRVFLFFLFLLGSFVDLCSSSSPSQSNFHRNLDNYRYTYPSLPAVIPALTPPFPSPEGSTNKIIGVVGTTAASAFVVAGAFFLCFTCFRAQRREEIGDEINQRQPLTPAKVESGSGSELMQYEEIRELIVDEDGLDVLYWKKLKNFNGSIHKQPKVRVNYGIGDRNRPSFPTGRSTSSHAPALGPPAAATPPPPPPPEKKIAPTAPPPPPPPAPVKKAPPPPPPPALAKRPPPPPGKKIPPGPPKPPSGGLKKSGAVAKEDGSGSGKDQVMLKPLHWEKLNVNPDHSMIWDKIERGSFQYTDDKMEALFGFVPTNRKSVMEDNSNSKPSDPNAKIFILNPKKSRNTAIVLKSLGMPRTELIDSLLDGRDVTIETLEKLARTALTREEESEILAFDGDATKLADAESFLYNLLNAVPSAFKRASAMLFKLNYKSEILNVKEPLQVMEPACNELRSHGMFLRLLEAILKAGNRLNAGTARGDAKAFNLTTLLKLSDFKSSDGKTTLLSFVVHEVVRNEGRRSLLTQQKDNNTVSQNDVGSAPKAKDAAEKEEKEKELLRLGLPVVSGLSSEFLNVKKAAAIDYDALKNTLSSLKNRLDETNQLVSICKSSGDGGGFLKEMEQFLESAQMEMKGLQEEHTRVMSLVTKTTQYYQAGASNSKNPLLLFTIVKDFLGMLDQTCAGIARSLQVKKPAAAAAAAGVTSGSSSTTQQDLVKTRVIFPGLKKHFLLANKSNVSSDSEDDF